MTLFVALTMSPLVGLLNSIGPSWGWLLFFVWMAWQVYCPFPGHKTAFQSFRDDLTTRMDRHEVGQITLAEQVDGADPEKYREIHEKDRLTTSAFEEDET